MSDWMMPLFLGAGFWILGSLRSRVVTGGRPPNTLARSLRTYGTLFVVADGYSMLVIRSLLEGTPLYDRNPAFVIAASLVWLVIFIAIAIWRNRRSQVEKTY